MRKITSVLFLCFLITCIETTITSSTLFAQDVKEWTFLVFLNGNNNLDSFGSLNINQMEQVGSTSELNVVVQWASLANKKTQRLFITQDKDMNKVTSPILQDMGSVDMGDWKSLVEFVRWGVTHFPAKHYFINVWDHGSGWHRLGLNSGRTFMPTDISWDDLTGHSISTEELGLALQESAKLIGHKVDLYASDACLMAMTEVADEMSDAVEVFAGSEELEPAAGWPYHSLLNRWAAQPLASASQVGAILTEEYIKSYSGGDNGTRDATFSVLNLSTSERLYQAMFQFSKSVMKLDRAGRTQLIKAGNASQKFYYSDYRDLIDFIDQIDTAKIAGLEKEATLDLRNALSAYVVVNGATPKYAKAKGVAFWLPTTLATYKNYSDRYKGLKFHQHTQWGTALESLFQ